MALERRLREGLPGLASDVDPDVPASYDRVRSRARRQVRTRRITAGAAAPTVLVLVGVVASARVNDDEQVVVSDPDPIGEAESRPVLLAGTYQVVVDDVGFDALAAGTWSAALDADGTVALEAPAAFTGTRSGLFRATADAFGTDLFSSDLCIGADPGRYRWERSGDSVTFERVEDACAPRARLLASRPWTSGEGG
jgi:hypothetical protein